MRRSPCFGLQSTTYGERRRPSSAKRLRHSHRTDSTSTLRGSGSRCHSTTRRGRVLELLKSSLSSLARAAAHSPLNICEVSNTRQSHRRARRRPPSASTHAVNGAGVSALPVGLGLERDVVARQQGMNPGSVRPRASSRRSYWSRPAAKERGRCRRYPRGRGGRCRPRRSRCRCQRLPETGARNGPRSRLTAASWNCPEGVGTV